GGEKGEGGGEGSDLKWTHPPREFCFVLFTPGFLLAGPGFPRRPRHTIGGIPDISLVDSSRPDSRSAPATRSDIGGRAAIIGAGDAIGTIITSTSIGRGSIPWAATIGSTGRSTARA